MLILGINLLEGGNINGQKRIYNFILEDRENSMLIELKNKLELSFYLIQKEMANSNDEDLNKIISENELETIVNLSSSLKPQKTKTEQQS